MRRFCLYASLGKHGVAVSLSMRRSSVQIRYEALEVYACVAQRVEHTIGNGKDADSSFRHKL